MNSIHSERIGSVRKNLNRVIDGPKRFFFLMVLGWGVLLLQGAQAAVLSTDKALYCPGDIVTVTGSSWPPGDSIELRLQPSNQLLASTVQSNGSFTNRGFTIYDTNAGVHFTLTATASPSGQTANAQFDVPSKPAMVGPMHQSACIGGTATFTATVWGTGPFTYQWSKGGQSIPGANNYSLTIANVQTTDLGAYSLAASGPCYSATNSALLGTYLTDTGTSLPGVVGGSIAWGDFDNDGWLDIAISGRNTVGTPITRVLRNQHDGTFANISTTFAGVAASSVAWGDYDNDGKLDLLITGFDQTFANTLAKVYRNNGDGSFTDIGLALDGVGFGSASWADYNNDGRPDILLTGKNSAGAFVTKLYRNNGGGSFTEVAAGFIGVGYASAAWGDYNNDGYLDLVLVGLEPDGNAVAKLYRNNGNGTFTDVAASLIGISAGAVAWGDFNNDGYLDLVMIGYDSNGPSARMYRNNGNGTFTDIGAGLAGAGYCTVSWADFNNDGWLDLLYTGINTSTGVSFTKIYQNNGNGTFTDLNMGLPAGGIWHYAGSAAFGDFDNDGHLDLLLSSKDINDNPQTQLYRYCGSAPANQRPSAPSNLSATINGTSVNLSWNSSVDAETPQTALTYNLVIGTTPNGIDMFSPLSDLTTGFRRVVRLGRINHNTSFTLTNVPTGNYSWSVQAIDGAMAGSAFATPSSFAAGSLTACTPLNNQAACAGDTVSFSTTASGSGPFSYVWRKDGALVSGAATNSLTLSNVTLASAGVYCVEVTGPLNTVTNCAQLSVGSIPSGTLADQIKCPGDSVSFNASAGETGQFSYQWSKDGQTISGATNAAYAISSVSSSDAGRYCVVIANACASMTNCANLIVNDPITASALADQVKCPGESAGFSTSASGSGPFQYAWRKDGLLLNGQTNAVFTLASVTVSDAGVYSVEVRGTCNRVTNTAVLTVRQPVAISAPATLGKCPGESAIFTPTISGGGPYVFQWSKDGQAITDATNNNYAIPVVTTGDAGNYCLVVQGACNTVSNCTALSINTPVTASGPASQTNCVGGQVTLSTVASGPGPITYQWSKGGQILAGATSASLTINPLTAGDAGGYCVVVQGPCNSATNCATLVVNAAVTAVGPATQTVCAGTPVAFSTTAAGSGALTYQWNKNGTNIPNATNAVYSLAAATEADAGQYCVKVSDACSSVSNCATLTVRSLTTAAGPADQMACAGRTATLATVASGAGPFVYQWFKEGLVLNNATNASYSIAALSQPDTGIYTVIVQGACNSVTNSANLSIGTQVTVSGLVDQIGCVGNSATFSVSASGAGPFSYQWFKGTSLIAGGTNSSYTIPVVSAGDAGVYCVQVAGSCQTVTNCANLSVTQPITASALTNLVRCPGDSASFRTTVAGGSSYQFIWRKDGSLISGQTNEALNILIVTTNDNGLYTVEVIGSCNRITNSARLTVNQPVTLSGLADLTKCPGDTATFNVTASGTGPFAYQWSKDGQPIAGATNSTLTLTAVQPTDADNYCVVVQGACNSATSCAHLYVNSGLAAAGPVSQTNVMGSATTLSVATTGAGPFSYQWLKDGNVISGAMSAVYSMPSITTADAGTYCVIVQGACGRITNCATLTVDALMTASPLNSVTNCVGDSAIFNTVSSMPTNVTYRWTKDGQVIAGVTNHFYIVSPVRETNTGTYTVVVSGPYNNVTNSATLTVLTPVSATKVPNQMGCEGSSITFTTTATGSGPITYQWFKGGMPLTGATNNSYVLPSITASDAGTYAVIVSAPCNSVTNTATLGIGLAVDTTNLVNKTNCLGSPAMFSVRALGNGPFTYQWSKDGTNIVDGTNSSLAIPAITDLDAGWYCVIVTGSCSSTNNCAYLAVQADTMATPLTSITNCTGTRAMFHTVTYGAGPVTIEWYKNGRLMPGATNNDVVITNTVETDAGDYSVVVRGPCNSVTNIASLRFTYFVDSGVTLPGLTGGSVAWGDFNNDGLLDLAISGIDANGTPFTKVMRNRGDGSFADIGTSFPATCSGTLAWGDYNNDGYLDLLMAGYDSTFSYYITKIYRNNGDGTFSDSSAALEGMVYCSAAWGDYNNDGYLDVLIAGKPNSGPFATKLYRNNRDGTFTEVPTAMIGVEMAAVAWGDFNNDGRLDVIITGMEPFGSSVAKIYRNDGNGVFTDLGADLIGVQMGAVAWGDYNNDGYLDLLVSGLSGFGPMAKLYRNNGNGTFVDSGIVLAGAGFSTVQWGDFNNDGYLDLLETGFDNFATSITKVYRNNGDGTFTDLNVAFPGGQGFLANGMAAWGDFNNDGHLDVLACGKDEFGTKVSKLLTYCGSAPSNSLPSAPTGLKAVGTPNSVRLSWKAASDAQTPSNTLSYNLMIGTTPSSVNTLSPLADPNSGFRRLVSMGGNQLTTNCVLTNLTAGKYYWKVQAVDGAFAGSGWSAQSTFNVGSNTTLMPLVDQIVCVSDTAQFSTVASGAAPFRYLWKKNGTTISGATNATLTIANVSLASAGTYCVEVTGAYSSATNCAALTVRTITTTPMADQNKCLGESVTLSNNIIGVGPFTYQWLHSGQAIAGATNNPYIIASMTTNDVGQYTVLIYSPCSTMTNSASLFLNTPTEATPLASQVKCAGENASFSTLASGTGPFTYVWRKDGQLLSGKTNSVLDLVSLTSSNSGLYSVEVIGACNTVTNTAQLTVHDLTMATPLSAVTNCSGSSAMFNTVVSGTGPFTYQWSKNGQLLVGATNNYYMINASTPADAGTYCVVIQGLCNSVTNCATLIVNTPLTASPLVPMTNCVGNSATFATVVTGSGPFSYQWSKDGQVIAGATNNSYTLASVQDTNAGNYCVVVRGGCNSVTNCASLTVNLPTTASALTDQAKCPGENASFGTTVTGTGPFSYVWRKDGVLLDGQTNNSLSLPAVTAAEAGVYSVEVRGTCTTATNSARLIVNELTAATPLVNLAKCGGESASFSTVVTGTGPFRYTWRKDGNILTGQTNGTLSIAQVSTNDGGLYTVEVNGLCNIVSSSARLTVNQPTVATGLDDLSKCVGEDAVFSTTVSGGGPYVYEWRKNGVILMGQNSNLLTLQAVTTNDAATYTVKVIGACNSSVNSARLTVNEVQSATPLSAMVKCEGESATFSTVMTGLGTRRYAWRKDGFLLTEQTNSFLTIAAVSTNDAGLYTLEIITPCNTLGSSAALTVNRTTLATALSDQVKCAGENVSFSTTASGTGPFQYRWLKNGALLNGETNNFLNLSGVTTNDSGLYSVEVSGLCNTATNSARLTVNGLVAIAPMPDQARCPGDTASFSPVITGAGPFRFVWKKNGTILAGQTNGTLSLLSVSNSHAGIYTVEVNGACNSATNSAALILNQPTGATPLGDQVACAGDTVTISTSVSGTGPFRFVWKKNGAILSGQSNSSLILPAVTASDSGNYSVEAGGSCFTMTNTAHLTVNDLTTATPIQNQVKCAGENARFSTTVAGTGPFRYVWRKDGVVLNAQTNSVLNLWMVSSNDAGLYMVTVSGVCNSITSSARLTVNQPTIANALDDQAKCVGESATFSINVSGSGPFVYEWRKDGVLLMGQTSNSLSFASVRTNDAGVYSVLVSGACNSVINSARLTVNVPISATPLSDVSKCVGESANFSTIASGTGPLRYLWRKEGAILYGKTNSTLSFAAVAVGDSGLYSVEISGACKTVTNSARLTVNELALLSPMADQLACAGDNVAFTSVVSGSGPFQYVWRKDGTVLSGQTNSILNLGAVATNQAGLYTVEVSGICNSVTASARLTVNELTVASALTDAVKCVGESAGFSTSVSGTGPFHYVWKKDGVILTNQTNSALSWATVTTNEAGLYTVEVSGACNNATSSARLTVNRPTAATGLAGEVRCVGDSVSLQPVVTGTGPFRFVWRKNGTILSGQTSNVLEIAALTTSDSGVYTVEISGACNTVTNSATLTVNELTMTTPLLNQTKCAGNNAQFSTTPSGSGPFRFTWRKDGALLSGQTNSTLSIVGASASDAGIYTVDVMGACNTVSTGARLTVNQLTTATTLDDQFKCSGENAIFSTSVSGTGPFRYTWYKDGAVIPGQTNGVLTLTAIRTNDAGTYTVMVIGSCNSVINSAVLMVNEGVEAAPLADQAKCPGESATFSTSTMGAGPFRYLWKKDGVLLSGRTNDTLTLNSVSASDAGIYTIEIYGACNTISLSARLTVNQPIGISGLSDQSKCSGSPAIFNPTATGTGPYRFTWKKDGVALVGQTNSQLSFASVSTSDAGLYTLEVSGVCSAATNQSRLTVNQAATATPLSDLLANQGERVVFSTTASGTGPFSYVWRKNGALLAGAQGNAFTIASAAASDAGVYSVEISGACQTVTNTATLTVRIGTFATPLADQTVCAGDWVEFSTVATGAGPFSYLWRKDGMPLASQTNSYLSLLSAKESDAGVYCVIVTGSINAVTNCAMLTIHALTQINPLRDQTNYPGGRAVFSTTAQPNGSPLAPNAGPIQYTWYKDGRALAGQTNSSLVLTNLKQTDAGLYSVLASSQCNFASSSARLTLSPCAIVTNQVLADGSVRVVVAGLQNRTYALEYSTNFTAWTRLGTQVNPQTTVEFIDTTATGAPHRFYRAVLLP